MRQQNQAAGPKGRRVCWAAAVPENLETRFKRYEALVKVTSDKRFTEDSLGYAGALRRNERSGRPPDSAGQGSGEGIPGRNHVLWRAENELEGTDFKEPVQTALTAVIPNIYASFSVGDRSFDFARQLKAVLNPATSTLHTLPQSWICSTPTAVCSSGLWCTCT